MAKPPTSPLVEMHVAANATLSELKNPVGKGATLTAVRFGDLKEELQALTTGTASAIGAGALC